MGSANSHSCLQAMFLQTCPQGWNQASLELSCCMGGGTSVCLGALPLLLFHARYASHVFGLSLRESLYPDDSNEGNDVDRFSHRKLGMWKEFHPQLMLFGSTSEQSSKQVPGQQHICMYLHMCSTLSIKTSTGGCLVCQSQVTLLHYSYLCHRCPDPCQT